MDKGTRGQGRISVGDHLGPLVVVAWFAGVGCIFLLGNSVSVNTGVLITTSLVFGPLVVLLALKGGADRPPSALMLQRARKCMYFGGVAIVCSLIFLVLSNDAWIIVGWLGLFAFAQSRAMGSLHGRELPSR